MENNIFKRTEYILYNYKSLEIKIKNIEIDIENLKNSYQGVSAATFDERIGPTYKFNSSVENEVVRREGNVDKLIKELEISKAYNISLKAKTDNALGTLTPESLKLVELRYFKNPGLTWTAIGRELNMDKDYCCKKRYEVIHQLSRLIFSY